MRDQSGRPVIIDALIGKVTPLARARLPWLAQACHDARAYRLTGRLPENILAEVDDSEL